MIALDAIMKAVYDALSGSAPLASIVGSRIYDYVPEGTAEPYVSFFPVSVSWDNTKTWRGVRSIVQVNVVSLYQGTAEIAAAMEAIDEAMSSLTVTGYNLIVSKLAVSSPVVTGVLEETPARIGSARWQIEFHA